MTSIIPRPQFLGDIARVFGYKKWFTVSEAMSKLYQHIKDLKKRYDALRSRLYRLAQEGVFRVRGDHRTRQYMLHVEHAYMTDMATYSDFNTALRYEFECARNNTWPRPYTLKRLRKNDAKARQHGGKVNLHYNVYRKCMREEIERLLTAEGPKDFEDIAKELLPDSDKVLKGVLAGMVSSNRLSKHRDKYRVPLATKTT